MKTTPFARFSNHTAYDIMDSSQDADYSDFILDHRYRIMSACTQGGFCDVLICWDTRLQRRCAIKRIPLFACGERDAYGYQGSSASAGTGAGAGAQDSNPLTHDIISSTMEEALREARVASMLAHPNISSVFDFQTDENFAYLVMEYIDGITLAELLARVEGGVLTPDEASYLTRALASALAFAHENRVLHLDIKPQNIMFDRNGCAKLCDFGMANLASAQGYEDARGGTLGYMPPEQLLCDVVDERSDIFSCGCVLWQALSGSCPFAAKNAQSSLKLIDKGPKTSLNEALSDLAPIAQTQIEEALRAALCPQAQLRTAHIQDLAHQLVRPLGSPDLGQKSLAELVNQALADDETDVEAEPVKLSLSYRFPWLEPFFWRALGGISGFGGCWNMVYTLFPQEQLVALCVLCGIALVSALYSPCALVAATVLLICTSFHAGASFAAFGVCVILCVLLFAWFFACGEERTRAAYASMMPLLSFCPLAQAVPAAILLSPVRAGTTTFLSSLMGIVYVSLVQSAFAAEPALQQLTGLINAETAALLVLTAAASACGSALIRHFQTRGIYVFAELLITAATASILFMEGVKNAAIWVLSPVIWPVVAVSLSILINIVIILNDSQPTHEEVENTHESD